MRFVYIYMDTYVYISEYLASTKAPRRKAKMLRQCKLATHQRRWIILSGKTDQPLSKPIQHASSVILQKSTREGFGLVVSEGLWKEKPIVAGAVGGITMQIIDGECGFLASSNAEYVEKVSKLLNSPQLSSQMGSQGKQRVLDNFLITRLLKDHLNLIGSL